LGDGLTRTLTAARAVAHALVMVHETRGLEPYPGINGFRGPDGFVVGPVFEGSGWHWRKGLKDAHGTAATIREARKAAREAGNG